MKERPILFSPAMIRAIFAGTKTQTRRVVFGKQAVRPGYDIGTWDTNGYDVIRRRDIARTPWTAATIASSIRCPYGQPGDRLWVRETWAQHTIGEDTFIVYRADSEPDGDGAPWKPSIFMPRTASRILLELTSVRVERLQDISEQDAQAEGVDAYAKAYCSRNPEDELTAVGYYELLWDSLNGERGLGWATNPWVWVVEFRYVRPTLPLN